MPQIPFAVILLSVVTIAILTHDNDALIVRLLRVHGVKKSVGSGYGAANGAKAGALGLFIHGLLNNKKFKVLGGGGFGLSSLGVGGGLNLEGQLGDQPFRMNKQIGNNFEKGKSGGQGKIVEGNAYGFGKARSINGEALATADVIMPSKTKNRVAKPVNVNLDKID